MHWMDAQGHHLCIVVCSSDCFFFEPYLAGSQFSWDTLLSSSLRRISQSISAMVKLPKAEGVPAAWAASRTWPRNDVVQQLSNAVVTKGVPAAWATSIIWPA
ncbi:hypothetical protein FRX31_018062 [Thalictrum thalictroides]|uniref:Uncharacterized protein n=1 Tax=Thalictrum thalictroides TaxID=46969 RepID=A0A7J6W571_THATH|nr:hypothetical protein FRX31_018062 [Thalictrum thalictroides]